MDAMGAVPTYEEVLDDAIEKIHLLKGHTFNALNIDKPSDKDYARFLPKIVSKLSSIIGNMIEYRMAAHLNESGKYSSFGKWIRQDPGFPDNIFKSKYLDKIPGIEIKAWFPFATEITARFKESYQICGNDHTYVALIAWLPEFILHGRPKIIDVLVEPAAEIAKCRDNHYYKPPTYLVIEPQDTIGRTANLQQSNVEGYVIQADSPEQRRQLEAAKKEVREWDDKLKNFYSPVPEVIEKTRELRSKYTYRLDTNFGKINRIENSAIKAFKEDVYSTEFHNESIAYWRNISKNKDVLEKYINLWKEKGNY